MSKGITTIFIISEYDKKYRTFPQNTEKQLQKIAKFEKKLNDKKIHFSTDSLTRANMTTPRKEYKEIKFCWMHYPSGHRIEEYERLLKQQKIRFRKTMDDIKATFTWDTTKVNFL